MAIYFGMTEITKLRDLAPQAGLDITGLWFGNTNVYTVWAVYEGTLPATLNANGDEMRQYKIYGNTGGVGEIVTNIFDPETAILAHYRINDNANTFAYNATSICYFIPVSANTTYTITDFTNATSLNDFIFRVAFADQIPTAQTSSTGTNYGKQRINSDGGTKHHATLTNDNHTYLAIQLRTSGTNDIMVTEGSQVPASFVPYGHNMYFMQMNFKSRNLLNSELIDNSYPSLFPRPPQINLSLKPNTTYVLATNAPLYNYGALIVIMDTANYSYTTNTNGAWDGAPRQWTTDATGKVSIAYRNNDSDYDLTKFQYSLTEGTDVPTKFESYLDMSIYIKIGETALQKDEYVDYKEQKVYRMIDGTLTPTDPPEPLPALPTADGETTVSYTGGSVAPEKGLLKYRKEGY